MRLSIAVTLLAFLATTLAPIWAVGAEKATDFALEDMDGETVYLSDFLGKKVVLINFWATWCKPCHVELPVLEKLWKKYCDRGLVVLAVNADGPSGLSKVRAEIQRMGLTFPVLLDRETKVLSVYNPRKQLPSTFLIGTDGRIRFTRDGFSTGDEQLIEKEIVKLLEAGSQ